MARKLAVAILLVLVVIGAVAGVKVMQIKTLMAAGKSFTPPPETISSAVVKQETWQNTLSAIGSIAAVQGVNITPELPGLIREIAFEPGAMVNKGDLLVKLDTSSEEAQLRAVEAQVDLAKINLERVRSLRKGDTIAQSELDTAEATLKQLQANADAIRTTIAKKTIRAPFDGHLGIRLVNVGQYLEPGKPIVSLQSLSPVFVDFSLPQQELGRLKTGMSVRLTTDAYTNRVFEGMLSTINPDLESSTRSLSLQATVANQDQALRPGMFARAEVLLPENQNVIVIPTTSILSAPFGDSVYLIDAEVKAGRTNLTVHQQFVRTGRARGDFISIETGLKPGQRVVTSGVFKLRNGTSVVENNNLVPASDLAPKPADS
jgi:membrane fusion protein, multidrug efflux system